MDKQCEVVGWLLENDAIRVMVREKDGHISLQKVSAEGAFAKQAIQTGSFRRGSPIVDPVTHETVGYEMERLPSPFAASV
jgi:hypothetical protein